MNSILPIDDIQNLFDKPIRVEQMGMDQLGKIVARHPHKILNTAVTVCADLLRRTPRQILMQSKITSASTAEVFWMPLVQSSESRSSKTLRFLAARLMIQHWSIT